MKVSYSWLKQYIDIDESPEKLGEIMTSIGLEVEGMDEVESIKGGLEGVVIGKVLTRDKHPNADRLSVTTVDVGDGEPLPIVCGAPNVAAGQKVLVATVGTTLYDKDLQPWKIKKGKIRGESSHGMICAEDELQLGKSHDGIMVLPEDVPVGTRAAEYFDIETDFVYDIGLTPNRSDATSQLGTARDLLAYFNYHRQSDLNIKLPKGADLPDTESPYDVEVKNTRDCPRYSGIGITNVKVGPSPEWIKKRLESIGVRSINNVVDITNFVLHEYGQPLHAFDGDKINGKKIIVGNLPDGTPFVTLDEVERKLSKEDLMICDGDMKPMCIGGVFGGIGSEVTEGTTRIFLESAYFDAVSIRKTSTRHLLRTDAAKCFEKGTDPNRTVEALGRAVALLQEYAGAELDGGLIDIYPERIEKATINISLDYINRTLGEDMSADTVKALLKALNMEYVANGDDFAVGVPTDKFDVTRPADLVEELLRIYGMDNVTIDHRHHFTVNHENFGTTYEERKQVSGFLVGRGFNEIMGLSLMQNDMFENREGLVEIHNTSNVHLNVMRPDVLLSTLESVAFNINRQQEALRLFEFGKAYQKTGAGYKENEKLVLIMSGPSEPECWQSTRKDNIRFFDLKSEVERLLDKIGFRGFQVTETENNSLDYGLDIRRGPKIIGSFGKISRSWLRKFGIKQDVFGASLDWKTLVKGGFKSFKVEEVSKYPSVRRDIAFVIDRGVAYAELEALISKSVGKLLAELDLFDVYENEEQLGEGKKSYAIKLVFSDKTKTLKDKEVDKTVENVIRALKEKLNAEVRR